MSSHYSEAEAQTIRAFVRDRKKRRRLILTQRIEQARRDFDEIVAIEHVHPAYADFIRRRGRIVHER